MASTPADTTANAPAAAVSSSAPAVDSDQQIASPFGAPTDDAESHAAAIAAARTGMLAFASTSLPYASWYAQLSPLLSATARQAYAGTDPANIPAHTITGTPTYLPGQNSTAYLARVSVATNVGTYIVLLSREGAGKPWLIERFTSPPGVGK